MVNVPAGRINFTTAWDIPRMPKVKFLFPIIRAATTLRQTQDTRGGVLAAGIGLQIKVK